MCDRHTVEERLDLHAQPRLLEAVGGGSHLVGVKEAGAVFLIAHQLDSIKEMCNRVLWGDQGRLVMDGDADRVVDAYIEATGD